MANESLAVSAHHSNFILKILSANQMNMDNNYSIENGFDSYYLNELNTLVGLAFTAILTASVHVNRSRLLFNIFIKHRNVIHSGTKSVATDAILQILRGGLVAFEVLGYPHYFDDFIWAYRQILDSTNTIHPEVKKEMRPILRDGF